MVHSNLTNPCSYIQYSDLRSIPSLDEQTLIAIKAPNDSPYTTLDVPDPLITKVD